MRLYKSKTLFLKTEIIICLFGLAGVLLCGCSKQPKAEKLADMSMAEGDGYAIILWEDRSYVPFCVVSKNDCGTWIGYVDGDKDHRVCEYKDYPMEEWIAVYLTVDGGAMLWKEISVTDIPDGMESEYEWNN